VAIGAVAREAGIAGARSPPLRFFERNYGFQIQSGSGDKPTVWMIRKGDMIDRKVGVSVRFDYLSEPVSRNAFSTPSLRLKLFATGEDQLPVYGHGHSAALGKMNHGFPFPFPDTKGGW
jgi:hypothetical protein